MDLEAYVCNILEEIKTRKMAAVKKYSKKFDDYTGPFRVKKEKVKQPDYLSDKDKNIIKTIIDRVRTHHQKQLEATSLYPKNGSLYGFIYRPINRIGIYVPGGKPLPSTFIMVAVPALIAGVNDIMVATPPKNGTVDPYILYIADILNIDEIYKLGGIQAIGAMAYGIGMEKVNKLFGPGNKYVNEAKRQLYGTVGINSLAGPSEIAVIADNTVNKKYVINDLLSQKDHGEDAKAWLLTTSKQLASYCNKEDIHVKVYNNLLKCVEKANQIAPEHLSLLVKRPRKLLDYIENAGAVYLGEYTPVAAADYFLGVNHVLPTGKSAKFDSVLSVTDFLKRISVAQVSKEEFLEHRYLGERLAKIEDMPIHKKSLEVRKNEKKDKRN